MLSITGLNYAWGQDELLFKEINAELSFDQSILLTGENGAGKSTLLKLLVGALKPSSGAISFEGLETHDPGCRLFSEVFYLAQEPLDNIVGITPYEDLAVWQLAQTPVISANELDTLLDNFGLSALAHKPIAHLSTGERRLVTLCMLPKLQHKFWILDEPFVGLDTHNRSLLTQLLIAKQQSQSGFLIVSHELENLSALITEQWEVKAQTLRRCEICTL